VGLVPAVDRTFYYRISGLENLAFFARLYGYSRREAIARSRQVMADVGLEDAMKVAVGVYSHGMQKRLAVARALLPDPVVLLVDEATHDLDPEGARRIRELVAACADRGVAVLWTTQRVEEIRGFADRVTLLRGGRVVFQGTVPALMSHAVPRRFLLHVHRRESESRIPLGVLNAALGEWAVAEPSPDGDARHVLLALRPGGVLGDAISALSANGVTVLSCTEEQPKIEQAFMSLTSGDGTDVS
jgi:ABC-2 type transport system ATP-binding protein